MRSGDKKCNPNAEDVANRFTLKCIGITVILNALTCVMDWLDIFIVDRYLMGIGLLIISIILVVMFVITRLCGLNRWWIKYMLILGSVLITAVVGTTLTYHVVLISALPLLYSSQYTDRRVMIFAYVLTVASLFVIVMGGYYFGLCDANMVYLTASSMSKYTDPLTGAIFIGEVNPNPWVTLPLYFVLPRSLILFAFLPVVRHISDNILQQSIREANLRRHSEIDEMTQLYNRNKYLHMIDEYYPAVEQVGVIFWDVNGLKETNDNRGHEYGDRLIAGIAETIRDSVRSEDYAFRIGGDEFIAILEGAGKTQVESVVARWKDRLEQVNRMSDFKLSASVGYAVGCGAKLEDIVKQADAQMYEAKQRYKAQSGSRGNR